MSVRKLNDKYFNIVSENLKKYRKQKHLSQDDLVKDLNLLGINMHKNDIYLIERNQRTVKDYEIFGFLKVLDIKFEDLYKDVEKFFEN